MKPFDTDKMPWLFTPHGDGELNEYFRLQGRRDSDERDSGVIEFS